MSFFVLLLIIDELFTLN